MRATGTLVRGAIALASSALALASMLAIAAPAEAATTLSPLSGQTTIVTIQAQSTTSAKGTTTSPPIDVVAKIGTHGEVQVLSSNGTMVPVAYRATIGANGTVATYDAALHKSAKLPSRLPNVALTPVIPTETQGAFEYNWVLDGQPMRYGTCRPIVWTLDPTLVQQSGVSFDSEVARWTGIFQEVAAVTGYQFQYQATEAGLGSLIAPGAWNTAIGPGTDHADVDILLAYRTVGGTNGYADLAGQMGLGGVGRVSYREGAWAMDTSVALFNADAMRNADPVTRIGAMRHELGHALGLGHVDAAGQVMGASGNAKHVTWQGGDVQGLQTLAAMPCPVQL